MSRFGKNCPDCNSENAIKLKWKPYKEQVYKCKDCQTLWDKNTEYCKECRDVVMYCKCYEDMYK